MLTKYELEKILQDHAQWLENSSEGEKANLRYSDLSGANLRGADLRYADLRCAHLSDANLRGADLIYFTYNRDTAYFTFDRKIRIGCEYHSIDYWKKKYKEIGDKNNYTDLEIKAYKKFIDLCAELDKDNK